MRTGTPGQGHNNVFKIHLNRISSEKMVAELPLNAVIL